VSEQLPFESVYRHGFARVAACTIPVAIADPAQRQAVIAAARAPTTPASPSPSSPSCA
jgi:NAD+ synthase (glutamine-hydrolysing)